MKDKIRQIEGTIVIALLGQSITLLSNLEVGEDYGNSCSMDPCKWINSKTIIMIF